MTQVDRQRQISGNLLALKHIDYFKKVKSDGTTLVWPNGLDLCPDVLYEMGKNVKTSKSPLPSEKPQTRVAAKSKGLIDFLRNYARSL